MQQAACQLADDEGMAFYFPAIEQLDEITVTAAKMVYPNRSINQHDRGICAAAASGGEFAELLAHSRPAPPVAGRSLGQ